MRPACMIAITLAAALSAACTKAPTLRSGAGSPTAHDSLVARAYLEDEALNAKLLDSLYVGRAALDSVARAVAVFRAVDTAIARVLGDSSHDRQRLVVGVLLGFGGRADSVFADSLVRCAGAKPNARPIDSLVTTSASPLPPGCWPQLDSALAGLAVAGVSVQPLFQAGLSEVVVRAPLPFNRWALSARITQRTGHGMVLPSASLIEHPLERRDSLWTFTFHRGYGDCENGCIYNRSYEYRYDPRTGRAWKHGESGAPWPPAKGSTLP